MLIITDSFKVAFNSDKREAKRLIVSPADLHEIRDIVKGNGILSTIEDKTLNKVLVNTLGVDIPHFPGSVPSSDEDTVIVVHLIGEKLPETATVLPVNSRFDFSVVKRESLVETAKGIGNSLLGRFKK